MSSRPYWLLSAILAIVWTLDSPGRAEDLPVLEAPSNLAVAQVGYGSPGEVELTWESPTLYQRVEIAVDDGSLSEPAPFLDVEGSARMAWAPAEPGSRRFSVRGIDGPYSSPWISTQFEVLRESPIPEPVRDLKCDFLEDQGGRLHVTWTQGPDAWVSGRVELPRYRIAAEFGPGTTEASIPANSGEHKVAWIVFRDAKNYSSPTFAILCSERRPTFLRGDCNGSGSVNITDAIFLLNHLFRSGPRWFCDDACDADDDGSLNITDAIAILRYLFQGAGNLPAPSETCGEDPTFDFLGGYCFCALESAP